MDIIEGHCCVDCAVYIANNDDSGTSDDWNKNEVVAVMNEYHIVLTGDEFFFSTRYCDVCNTKLAGDRHDVTLTPYAAGRFI